MERNDLAGYSNDHVQGLPGMKTVQASAPVSTGMEPDTDEGSSQSLGAASQLLSFSFPGTPCSSGELGHFLRLPSENTISSRSAPASPPITQSAGNMLRPRPVRAKRSRLYRTSHYSEEEDMEFVPPTRSQRRHSRQSSSKLFGKLCMQSEEGDEDEDELTDVEAACVLMQLAQDSNPSQLKQLLAIHAAVQDTNQQAHLPSDPAAVVAAASAALAASSLIRHADLALASADLARYFFSMQAQLDATAHGPSSAQAATPKAMSNSGAAPVKASTTTSLRADVFQWPITPLSPSPFAASQALHSVPSQPDEANDEEDDEQTAAFASIWALQYSVQAQLPAIKIKGSMHHQRSAAGSPAHAAPSTTFGSETPQSFWQFAQARPAPATPPYKKQPGRRLHTFSSDQSSFARDVAAHVSEDAQASIRGHWASVGRVAVSCGPAGCEGIKGIFTLNPAGKPVIWVPTTSAAAAHMGSLVAASAGCDSNEVPAGYQEVAPKVFEEMGGKGKTRNWQLSVAVIGLSEQCGLPPSPKQPFTIRLGHLARICGIPTAKA